MPHSVEIPAPVNGTMVPAAATRSASRVFGAIEIGRDHFRNRISIGFIAVRVIAKDFIPKHSITPTRFITAPRCPT